MLIRVPNFWQHLMMIWRKKLAVGKKSINPSRPPNLLGFVLTFERYCKLEEVISGLRLGLRADDFSCNYLDGWLDALDGSRLLEKKR